MKRILNVILIATGILFIFSLLTGDQRVLTICLTLFIVAVAMNCCDLWKGQNVFVHMFDKTESNAIEGFKNKQYGKAIINLIASPMVIVGVIMAVLCLICMWVRL